MPTTTRDGRRISWELHPAAAGAEPRPPLVLVPGLGSGRRLFGTLPRRIQRAGRAALVFDPVGVPPSSPLPGGVHDFRDAARDLLAVLDDAGLGRVALAGTSLGGKVALQVLAEAPERATALVLLASSAVVTPRAQRVHRFFETIASSLDARGLTAALLPFLLGATFQRRHPAVVDDIERALRPDASRRALMLAQARSLQHFDGAALARVVRCPTLCVAGLEDTLTSPDEVGETAALIRGARLLEKPAAGHALLLESAELLDEVLAFLDEHGV